MTFEKVRAKVCHTGVPELSNLGVGNVMYFVLLKYLMITFSVMTVVCVPFLSFAGSGNGVLVQDDIGACVRVCICLFTG